MLDIRGLVLLACAALVAIVTSPAPVQARQGGGFFFAPFFAPSPWQYYGPPRRGRYDAPPRSRHAAQSRKRKAVAAAQRKLVQARRKSKVALAVPARATPSQTVGCERARAIVAEYGFTNIKVEACSGPTLDFAATRDGKPFSIQVAVNGELARVRRHR